jgi:hypothetical protein
MHWTSEETELMPEVAPYEEPGGEYVFSVDPCAFIEKKPAVPLMSVEWSPPVRVQ